MSSASQGAVQVSFPRFRSKEVNDLPSHNRNMRKLHLMTGAVPLPVIVKALDGILQRGVVLEEAIHSHHLKNIAQERTHTRQLEITVQISKQLEPFQQNSDAQIVDMIYGSEIQHDLGAIFFNESTDHIFNPNHLPKIDIAGHIEHRNILDGLSL